MVTVIGQYTFLLQEGMVLPKPAYEAIAMVNIAMDIRTLRK